MGLSCTCKSASINLEISTPVVIGCDVRPQCAERPSTKEGDTPANPSTEDAAEEIDVFAESKSPPSCLSSIVFGNCYFIRSILSSNVVKSGSGQYLNGSVESGPFCSRSCSKLAFSRYQISL